MGVRAPSAEIGFTVVGAGGGGLAMAGHLGLLGHPVRLLNRTPERVAAVAERGGVELEGALHGFGRVLAAGSEPDRLLEGSRLVMVVVPAHAHREVAAWIGPHLRPGQAVVLHPGRTLGALEFEQALRSAGAPPEVPVAEAQTLLYASRAVAPGRVHVYQVKREVRLAALPAWRTGEVLEPLARALPQFVAAPDVLATSLGNVGAIFHPAPTLLNLARIDAGEPFEYYRQGISPAVARLLEALDEERLAVARALGVAAQSARRWLEEAYGAAGDDLHGAIQTNPAYEGIAAPASLPNRYILEDVPTGLVPLVSLGRRMGVPVPLMEALVALACQVAGADLWARGRTLENLGFDGAEQLLRYVREGGIRSWLPMPV
ncbi:MAG: NAD/NADP octopine/nopaline dehydrogenase family protein [Clostridia bacterium]|nr:NAD/NADP octopine/nopaline dehydrogenase family protein [Clostridia bacterium]MCL6522762.1 NAD/NADP octopine/nopaline dehydrogenase family protein [Bacillota bacterium]